MDNPLKMTPDDWRKKLQGELDYERENKKMIIAMIITVVAAIAILTVMLLALQEVLAWTPPSAQ